MVFSHDDECTCFHLKCFSCQLLDNCDIVEIIMMIKQSMSKLRYCGWCFNYCSQSFGLSNQSPSSYEPTIHRQVFLFDKFDINFPYIKVMLVRMVKPEQVCVYNQLGGRKCFLNMKNNLSCLTNRGDAFPALMMPEIKKE